MVSHCLWHAYGTMVAAATGSVSCSLAAIAAAECSGLPVSSISVAADRHFYGGDAAQPGLNASGDVSIATANAS